MSDNATRAELEAAPARKWDEESEYEFLYLLPTRKRHDSGWHLIAIVGANGKTLERAALCDDICWRVDPPPYMRGFSLRTDMTFPSGVIRCWAERGTRFRVGISSSSTEVRVIRKAEGRP